MIEIENDDKTSDRRSDRNATGRRERARRLADIAKERANNQVLKVQAIGLGWKLLIAFLTAATYILVALRQQQFDKLTNRAPKSAV